VTLVSSNIVHVIWHDVGTFSGQNNFPFWLTCPEIVLEKYASVSAEDDAKNFFVVTIHI